ncbi:hypothetical protein PSTG_08810 [Puccinia striiformis f. sp. tritici PST-78]|uniref:Uncharacterized protein n=1 Tax=Puccinia striiformis f. sp. tritici PST-78 TaxID=1165861 RepID=A0A0L0VF56_9BASI|nr:hypothetical protein PSTG_08810 [Puccinia striiformis f. sp. tritici PST-78]
MALEMYELINNNDPSNSVSNSVWDPTSMHIRCICHKIALIVNAGLAALSLKTLPSRKTKQSVLGFFPVLGRLTEEDTPAPLTSEPTETTEIEVIGDDNVEEIVRDSDSNYGNVDEDTSNIVGYSVWNIWQGSRNIR